jgi:predicted Zn finger-like uncharacterized protein
MEVRCERCRTQYELDDSRISETGVTVQCTNCHHVFVVKKKALVVTVPVAAGQQQAPTGTPQAPPAPAPPGLRPLSPPINMPPPVAVATTGAEPSAPVLPPSSVGLGEKSREWRVRQASGNVFTLKDLTTLQKWIVERKISRDDEISLTGESWKRLGDIAELATFFQLVDEAQRAAVLQAQLAMAPGATPPGAPQGQPLPLRPAPPVASPPPQPVALQRKGSRLPVVLLLLLALGGAGGAFYYLQVFKPQQEEEARRVAAAQRLEEERRERERQEKLLAAQAESAADAGSTAPPQEDGGALAGVGGPDTGDGGVAEDAGAAGDGGLGDAGMDADAGFMDAGAPMDAGTAADAGAPEAGAADAGPKRPAPVRDFDYYMAQGDRLRERERTEAALEAYGEAAELEPDRAEPYSGRGMAFLDMGDNRQAEAEFKQALKLNPRYGEAIMGLAETYRSQGKNAEAVRYYERYLEILPNGPEASVARSAIERLKQ